MVNFIPAQAFSWPSQAQQYAYRVPDQTGIWLERHALGVFGKQTEIDCLLYRDDEGLLIGILNHYCDNNNPLEQPGNVNVWTKPSHQRQGIATELLLNAMRRWPDINLEKQNYTPDGIWFIAAFIERGLTL